MSSADHPQEEACHTIATLRAQLAHRETALAEAKETLRALREGEVDALVVSTPHGPRVFTLHGEDHAYRVIIEQMQEGAVTLFRDGQVNYSNRRFAEMVQRPLEQIIGSHFSQHLVAPDRAGFLELLQRTREGASRGDLTLLASDGTQVPAHVALGMMLLDDVASIGMVVTDLREGKRAEELRAAKTAAELANRAKDHFLAVLSHELRTPLTPVVMGLAMLQDRTDLDPAMRETLEMFRRNIELEARLIDDLLDVTRIARGKLDLNRVPVALGTVIQRAVEVCQPDLEARRLDFGMDLGPTAPYWVEADVARLQQVFWNLLKNAIKFTPNGGCVGIRCRPQGEQILVEVHDSGIGMEPEALPRIFHAFEQAELSHSRQFGGLGLGLAISKALVELHGGSLEAHSPGRNQGATFRIRLPLTAPAGTPEVPTQAASPPRVVRPLRILLVEDHGVTAKMMRMVLTSSGHAVQLAGDVATALDLASQHSFDLLLSDLGLPDGSGHDLMRQLRQRGYRFPGIALSGYGREEDMQRSLQAGFATHLTKPASREAIAHAVASVTAVSHTERE